MKIQFMLHQIKDVNLLYYKEEVDSPFGGEEKGTATKSLSKEYSGNVLNDALSRIQGSSQVKYYGCRQRISREEYEVRIAQTVYEVIFTVNTIGDAGAQLEVEISSKIDNSIGTPMENNYDRVLELLKIALKDRLLQDWDCCIWVYDEQSEYLCSCLYPQIFQIENRFREFANRILVIHLGSQWINLFGLEKYKESADNLANDFQMCVPEFRDIDTAMFSVTLETLAEILFKGKVYEAEVKLSRENIKSLEGILKAKRYDNARDFLERRRTVLADIWQDIVSVYLDDPEKFKNLFSYFVKHRNHVAHNKVLTLSAFNKMQTELSAFNTEVVKAIEKIEEENPSDELLETLQFKYELAEGYKEFEKHFLRDRIEGETGVKIRFSEEICSLFCDTASELCMAISDRYYLDPCFDYKEGEIPQDEWKGNILICSIQSNASEEILSIYASVVVDDDMDGDSILYIEAVHQGDEILKAECSYHNGRGHEGDAGECVADSGSSYDTSQLDEFKEELFVYIEEELNPYAKKLPSLEYEAGTEGGNSPVADSPCWECGKNGVSIQGDFYPIGKCCYCGSENEVHICEMCGAVYDEFGGNGHLCNACMPKQDE